MRKSSGICPDKQTEMNELVQIYSPFKILGSAQKVKMILLAYHSISHLRLERLTGSELTVASS